MPVPFVAAEAALSKPLETPLKLENRSSGGLEWCERRLLHSF